MKLTNNVTISVKNAELEGDLTIPDQAKGLILFLHGSGSSRKSSRNQFVANYLNQQGFATLLFDLLTEQEYDVFDNRFNMNLLSARLYETTQWVKNQDQLKKLPLGYFGASTGAASAIFAAAVLKDVVKAIVSRGGRPDLAEPVLGKLQVPVLLVVGSEDRGVLELNQQALQSMNCEKEITLVNGATHLFEEPGALDEVARLASLWFAKYLK